MLDVINEEDDLAIMDGEYVMWGEGKEQAGGAYDLC